MIEFHYETDFSLENKEYLTDWINRIIISESGTLGRLDFIFCDDQYMLDINQRYLRHDTLTDIISFDYSAGKHVSGDIFISVERVKENAKTFGSSFRDELLRVIAHGIMHLFGFNDKMVEEQVVMRAKENEKIKMFHVEQ